MLVRFEIRTGSCESCRLASRSRPEATRAKRRVILYQGRQYLPSMDGLRTGDQETLDGAAPRPHLVLGFCSYRR